VVQIRLTAKISETGDLDSVINRIKRAIEGRKAIQVGLPGSKVSGDVLQYAIWNHYGTSRGTPARPFITVAIYKNRSKLQAHMKTIAFGAIRSGTSLESGLAKLGAYATGLIQDQIASSMPPPNAPSTVQQKGSSGTLIDTGRLRQSVTWDWE